MKIVNQSYHTQIEVKKSVFIAHICPFMLFKDTLYALKQEHPKAVHFVYAYRHFNTLNQIIEDKSDDGEPKGTSALPCLHILRGNELINTAVIVVRYFGGIKLGTGGLVRAYSSAVNAVIAQAIVLEFEVKKKINLSLNLSLYARIEHYLLKNKIEFDKEFKTDKVCISVQVSEDEKKNLLDFAQRLGISP